jgi:hypothetical protein
MDLFTAWVAFPLLLALLATGAGLLTEVAIRRSLPGVLIPVCGLALVVVVGQFTTLSDATAELSAPLAVALAVAGFGLGMRRRLAGGWRWPAAAAAAVFAVYAAPIVLSGEATFAGYIRLDDTATWLALTDRVMEHGRSLDGLAPSTYEATLALNLGDGYPTGVFLPLGIVAELTGTDPAWLIQPYIACLGVLLALALYALARVAIASAAAAALVASLAAQPALLYGYYLWGGIKEVAAATLIASVAALVGHALPARFEYRALVPVAVASAALVGVLSAGGLIWLAGPLLVGLALAWRALAPRAALGRAAFVAAGVAVLSIPVLATGGAVPPTSSPLTDSEARGNLIEPLAPAQVAGIWPAGDFRVDPASEPVAYILIAAAIAAAAGGLVVAWRRRAWAPLAYCGGTLAAAAAIYAFGSPWVDGKALATASPVIPFAAGLAGAALLARRPAPGAPSRRNLVLGGAVLAAVAVGVLWSNALAYRDVNLAPREQLAELEEIGEAIAGQGPTLMTEYQPYGARHFLRDADPEAVSELRRRRVPLRNGKVVEKGETADTDALNSAGLFVYRTLVLRRSPTQSRPPLAYERTWSGDHYEVWQRAAAPAPAGERLGLGGGIDPTARPRCGQVLALAAGAEGVLVAAARPDPIVATFRPAPPGAGWPALASARAALPSGEGALGAVARVRSAGRYEVWLGGSVRPELELAIDGEPIGEVRHELNNAGQYVRLGETELDPDEHELTLRFGGADLGPGSGGTSSIGPLVLAPAGPGTDARLVEVAPGQARRLCGRQWDWIEAVTG